MSDGSKKAELWDNSALLNPHVAAQVQASSQGQGQGHMAKCRDHRFFL